MARTEGEAGEPSDSDWIGGVQAARALLEQAPEHALELRLSRPAERGPGRQLAQAARRAGVKLQQVPRRSLDALLPGIDHQGVAVRRSAIGYVSLDGLLTTNPAPSLVVVLDGITDPRNLGAIVRSAWAFEAQAVIVSKHRSAGLTPAAIKTAAGGAEHVPVCRVANTKTALEQLKAVGFWVYGAAAEGAVELAAADFDGSVALVLGAEQRGLRPSVRRCCDLLLTIPMRSAAGSLNVAVAAGVILARAYESRRSVTASSLGPTVR